MENLRRRGRLRTAVEGKVSRIGRASYSMEKESNIGKFSGALRADQLLENYLQGEAPDGEKKATCLKGA